jgi:hypothetical protein
MKALAQKPSETLHRKPFALSNEILADEPAHNDLFLSRLFS